jgi:hypothetical protein
MLYGGSGALCILNLSTVWESSASYSCHCTAEERVPVTHRKSCKCFRAGLDVVINSYPGSNLTKGSTNEI